MCCWRMMRRQRHSDSCTSSLWKILPWCTFPTASGAFGRSDLFPVQSPSICSQALQSNPQRFRRFVASSCLMASCHEQLKRNQCTVCTCGIHRARVQPPVICIRQRVVSSADLTKASNPRGPRQNLAFQDAPIRPPQKQIVRQSADGHTCQSGMLWRRVVQ